MALPKPKPQFELPSEPEAKPFVSSFSSTDVAVPTGDRGPANELIAALSAAVVQEWAFDGANESGEPRWPLVKTFLVLGAAGSFCWMLIGLAAYLIF